MTNQKSTWLGRFESLTMPGSQTVCPVWMRGEGWHTVSPLSITTTKANPGHLWSRVCGRGLDRAWESGQDQTGEKIRKPFQCLTGTPVNLQQTGFGFVSDITPPFWFGGAYFRRACCWIIQLPALLIRSQGLRFSFLLVLPLIAPGVWFRLRGRVLHHARRLCDRVVI